MALGALLLFGDPLAEKSIFQILALKKCIEANALSAFASMHSNHAGKCEVGFRLVTYELHTILERLSVAALGCGV
jgi:hypothetical protein